MKQTTYVMLEVDKLNYFMEVEYLPGTYPTRWQPGDPSECNVKKGYVNDGMVTREMSETEYDRFHEEDEIYERLVKETETILDPMLGFSALAEDAAFQE
jgi:hypothetical protein